MLAIERLQVVAADDLQFVAPGLFERHETLVGAAGLEHGDRGLLRHRFAGVGHGQQAVVFDQHSVLAQRLLLKLQTHALPAVLGGFDGLLAQQGRADARLLHRGGYQESHFANSRVQDGQIDHDGFFDRDIGDLDIGDRESADPRLPRRDLQPGSVVGCGVAQRQAGQRPLARLQPAEDAAQQDRFAVLQLGGPHVEGRVDLHDDITLLAGDVQHFEPGNRHRIGGLAAAERAGQHQRERFGTPCFQIHVQQTAPVVLAFRPIQLAGSDLFQFQLLRQNQPHAVDGAAPDVQQHAGLDGRLAFRDPQQRLHLGGRLVRNRQRRQLHGERRCGELVRLIGHQPQRTFLRRIAAPEYRRQIGGDVGARHALGSVGAKIDSRAAADGDAPFVQHGTVDRHHGNRHLSGRVGPNGAALRQVQRDRFAVRRFFQQRDFQAGGRLLRVPFPAPDVVPGDAFDQIPIGQQDRKGIAAAARKQQVDPPSQTQPVFLDIQHGLGFRGQTAVDLALGDFRTPLQVQIAGHRQRRDDLGVVGLGFVFTAVCQTHQSNLGARRRDSQCQRGGRRDGNPSHHDPPSAAPFEFDAHRQIQTFHAFARDVQQHQRIGLCRRDEHLLPSLLFHLGRSIGGLRHFGRPDNLQPRRLPIQARPRQHGAAQIQRNLHRLVGKHFDVQSTLQFEELAGGQRGLVGGAGQGVRDDGRLGVEPFVRIGPVPEFDIFGVRHHDFGGVLQAFVALGRIVGDDHRVVGQPQRLRRQQQIDQRLRIEHRRWVLGKRPVGKHTRQQRHQKHSGDRRGGSRCGTATAAAIAQPADQGDRQIVRHQQASGEERGVEHIAQFLRPSGERRQCQRYQDHDDDQRRLAPRGGAGQTDSHSQHQTGDAPGQAIHLLLVDQRGAQPRLGTKAAKRHRVVAVLQIDAQTADAFERP